MERTVDTSCAIKRTSSADLDEVLGHAFPVLDYGFVRVLDYMGSDYEIVQAARTSYGRGTKAVSNDRSLIRYLLSHSHTTPFEMATIKLHLKMPVFVARQWLRHRTASVNEYSARYSILDREFYIPEREQLMAQSKTNNQGRMGVLDDEEADLVLGYLKKDARHAYNHYEEMIEEDEITGKQGLAREVARINLPVSVYTQFYWKIDLHNLLHFLRLRADAHAQYEIRVYADLILNLVAKWVPNAYEAFMDYKVQAVTFSGPEMKAIQKAISVNHDELTSDGLSVREYSALLEKLKKFG